MSKFCFIIAFTIISTIAKGQEVTLSGKVLEQDTKTEIPFAAVVLTQDKITVKACAADIDGRFTFDSIQTGKYEILIRVAGYKPFNDTAFVISNDSLQFHNFNLEPRQDNNELFHFLPYFDSIVRKKKKT